MFSRESLGIQSLNHSSFPHSMKSIITPIIVTITLAASLAVCAEELNWTTDLPKGAGSGKRREEAGVHSDSRLRLVLHLPRVAAAGARYAGIQGVSRSKSLVLVDADFPESTPQSPELKKANAAIKEKFNLGDIYPSFVVLNDAGVTVFQESGYHGGGLAEVMPNWRRHVKPAPTADAARIQEFGCRRIRQARRR